MNEKKENSDSIYNYLEPFLDTNPDEETIKEARKQYLKEYKNNWQRQYRKNNKQFTISFNKKEFTLIEDAATKHNRKCHRFIKEAVLVYCKQKILIPNPEALNHIQELLIMNYSLLKVLAEETSFRENERNKLFNAMTKLETEFMRTLKNEMYACD